MGSVNTTRSAVSRHDGVPMRVDKRMIGDVTVLVLAGDLDARSAPVAQRQLSDAIPERSRVLLDLADVGYVSSAGLRALLMSYRRAQAAGSVIVLVNVPETFRSILSATGFLRFFEVAESIPEADRQSPAL